MGPIGVPDDVVEHRRALALLLRPALDAAAPRLPAGHAHGDSAAHPDGAHVELDHGMRCRQGTLERRVDVGLEADLLRVTKRHYVGEDVAEADMLRVRAEGKQRRA